MKLVGVALTGITLLHATATEGQTPRAWTVDPRPVLTIGDNENDTTTTFGTVAGSTRLPNGQILVGDRGEFNVRLFSADGKPLRQFARKGMGPGEVNYLITLLRCGDSVLTLDVESGHRVTVFTLDGKYVRSFRFGSPQGGPPYRTACNGSVFAHFGWEQRTDMKPGTYRSMVPFWISGADSVVRTVIGAFPGSERFGQFIDGQLRGSRPLPLGKQPTIAVGADRVYIGTADRYEIVAYDITGNKLTTIVKIGANLETTKADIDYAKDLEIGGGNAERRAAVERAYSGMTLPTTIPAYRALMVDAGAFLWVQDYPRVKSPNVRWTVFSPAGRQVAEVSLPTYLEVYEIGRDYVLGRYLDPDESVPQVRMYRLTRSG